MTTRVPIRYGGTGANTAADARAALGVSSSETTNAAYAQANSAYDQANSASVTANNALPLSGGTVTGLLNLVGSGLSLNVSNNAFFATNVAIGAQVENFPLYVERNSLGVASVFITQDGELNPRLVIYGNNQGSVIQHTYSANASNLLFSVGGSLGDGLEAIRITETGNVGINEPNPTQKLHISGNTLISQNLIVNGDLFVEGNTVTFNVATLEVEDNQIVLNSNTSGAPSLNAFITVDRGSSTNTFLIWDENADKWSWSDDGANTYTLSTALDAYDAANNRVLKSGDTMTGLLNVANNLIVNGNVHISNTFGGINSGILVNRTRFFAFANTGENSGHPTLRTDVANSRTVLRVLPNGVPTSNSKTQFEFFAEDYFTDPNEWHNFRINAMNDKFIIDTSRANSNSQPRTINFDIGGSGNPGASEYANVLVISTGSVGINIGAPTSNLHVVGNANITLGINTATVNATTVNAQTFITATGANVFLTAINAYNQANAARDQANTARSDANTTFGTINTTFATLNTSAAAQNTAITNAHNQANLAYTAANTAQTTAQNAYGQANAAYNQANSAYGAANNRVLKTGDTMTGSLNFNFTGANSGFSIQNQNDHAVIEMGGANGAFIDMKSPNSDDYDFRIRTIQGSTTFVSNNAAQVVGFTGGANVNFDSGTLFVDSVNDRVGVGITTPVSEFQVSGNTITTGSIRFGSAAANSDNGILFYGADAYGFSSEFSTAVILRNEQGSTEQTLFLGDTSVGNAADLFGISVGTTPVLTLAGNGELAIASVVTSSNIATFGTALSIAANGNVGIGTTGPTSTLHVIGNANITLGIDTTTVNANTVSVYTTNNDIFIQDITTGTSTTDAGILIRNKFANLNSALFTEVSGQILSYGINVLQLDSPRDTSRVGGIFRLDTRTGGFGNGECFVVKAQIPGGNTELNRLVINLANGDTSLAPANGNVAIGTSTPTSKLHVIGTANITSNLVVGGAITENTNGTFYNVVTQVDVGTSPNQIPLNQYLGTLAYQDSDSVSLGQLSVLENIVVTGNVSAMNFDSTSDLNLKEAINEIQDPLNTLQRLHGVSFQWKSNKARTYGVIAQELEKVLPELVNTDSNGLKTVSYNGIIALLIEAVKSLSAELNKTKE